MTPIEQLLFTADKARLNPSAQTVRAGSRYPWFAALLALLISCTPLVGEAQTGGNAAPVKAANKRPVIENLVNIQESIARKQALLRNLREQQKQEAGFAEDPETEEDIQRLRNEIAGLQQSFEQITLGSINQTLFTEVPEQKINWKDEIEQISRPLLSSLKELTAKPRQIDSLRREEERREAQLKTIEKALESLVQFDSPDIPASVSEPVRQLRQSWEQRRDDTLRQLEITRYKLGSLRTQSMDWRSATWQALTHFISGRGLTLLLAIVVGIAIWLLSKLILRLYWRWLYRTQHNIGISRAPLFYYSYRLLTAIIIVMSVLLVFYIRGDVLFLTLSLIALAGIALTLRQTLPRYAAELRLLLGVGPVREGERMVLDGIPYRVESLSVFSVLRNPSLEGVVRLPLHSMNDYVSRPSGKLSWFPTTADDFIVLENGNLARVLRQTIEFVEYRLYDSTVQVRTQDFLQMNVRNLTRDGFGVVSSFGIDYQHQQICLDTVPDALKTAVLERLDRAGLRDAVRDILVEFKLAGSSSLDYQIYLTFNGSAAQSYYKLQRMIQQACVATCNRMGWVIPFTQVTVHAGGASAAALAGAVADGNSPASAEP